MLFLLDQDWKTNVPYNFIGDLKNLNNDITQLLNPLMIDDELKHDESKLFEYFEKIKKSDPLEGRQRQSDSYFSKGGVLSRYNINKSQLSDEIICKIMEIYWMDYICFPFDIPSQCDFNKMLQKHYNKDVVYKPCY